MSITKIEIQGFGEFEIKHDYLHRGNRPRLVTFDKGRFKEVQFDDYIENYEEFYPLRSPFQKGYDYQTQEILIRIVNQSDERNKRNYQN